MLLHRADCTWTVVGVAGYDLGSEPITVVPLPLWTGTVALPPPATDPATT